MSGKKLLISPMQRYVRTLVKRHPTIDAVWLIGSRANGREGMDSDWDFIAFKGGQLFTELELDTGLHDPNVDFLVVLDDGNEFSRPWGKSKTGSLSAWRWDSIDDLTASYIGKKWVPDEEEIAKGRDMGDWQTNVESAIKIWP